MLVVGFLLIVMVEFFCLWQWLSFCVNGGSCAFCLMVVVGFFVYGSGWVSC